MGKRFLAAWTRGLTERRKKIQGAVGYRFIGGGECAGTGR
jgi:hypothetical protein